MLFQLGIVRQLTMNRVLVKTKVKAEVEAEVGEVTVVEEEAEENQMLSRYFAIYFNYL